jgi:nucleoside phosphorylase
MEFQMIGVVVSLKKEIEPFLQVLTDLCRRRAAGCTLWEGSFRAVPLRIVVTGVGAEVPGAVLEGCRVLLSTGFCGALRPDMACGDLVLSREVTYAGKELLERITGPRKAAGPFNGTGLFRLRLAGRVHERLLEASRRWGLGFHAGRSLTCAGIVQNGDRKRKLAHHFDALSVDMEDYLRVGSAESEGIEALCARAVLDELNDEVPLLRGGVKLHGAVSLYRRIPGVQKSIVLLLEHVLPFLADTMENA